MADAYGIPPGGNNGAYSVKKLGNVSLTLSWEEMMAAVALGGWPQELWGMAGAVSAAESSRNPLIYNTFKMGHFGLFQISRSAHPEFFAPNGTGRQWALPIANATEGYKVYKSQGWGAWSAKTSGAYLAYYPQALTAAADLQRKTQAHGGDEKGFWESLFRPQTNATILKAVGVSDAVTGLANQTLGNAIAGGAAATAQGVVDSGNATVSAVGDMAQVVTGLWGALTNPSFWMRVGYGALGVTLVAGGLFLIIRNQPGTQKVAGAVASVVPGGAALKAVKGAA